MKFLHLALIGDYSPEAVAHQAIPRALERAAADTGLAARWDWVGTAELREPAAQLGGYDALWVVPRSPYANPAGVFAAIGWARKSGRPFLGTCGGFQHALLEFARQVAGLPGAEHAEDAPTTAMPVIAPLSCGLVEQTGGVQFAPGSRLRTIYGRDAAVEGYHCNYGLNAAYRAPLEAAGLRFTAWDDAGEVRAAEWPDHPFFLGTLFQPERGALRGETPPLVAAWLRAAAG
jgi:CTP synthase (UTP-ammonia lyase)